MKKIILFLSAFVAVCYLSTAVYSKTTAVQEYKFDIKHIGKASGENTYNLTIHKHCPTEYPYTTSQAKDLKCAAKISKVFNGVKCYRCKEEAKKEEPKEESENSASDICGSPHCHRQGFFGKACDKQCTHGTFSDLDETCTCWEGYMGEECNCPVSYKPLGGCPKGYHSDTETTTGCLLSYRSNDDTHYYPCVKDEKGPIPSGNETCSFHEFWDGKSGTQKIIAFAGDNKGEPYAAKIVNEYYVVSADDPDFGKGKWYLPALGELMDANGYHYWSVSCTGGAGANFYNRIKINAALAAIGSEKASVFTEGNAKAHVSTTAVDHYQCWRLDIYDGHPTITTKTTFGYVRGFNYLENKFDGNIAVGDIVYADMSYTTSANYNSNKEPVGVVTWVSDSGKSAKILSLKDLADNHYQYGGESSVVPGMTTYSGKEIMKISSDLAIDKIQRANCTIH